MRQNQSSRTGCSEGRFVIPAAVPALMPSQPTSGPRDFSADITGMDNIACDMMYLDVPNYVSLFRLFSTDFAPPISLLVTLYSHKVGRSNLHHGFDLVVKLLQFLFDNGIRLFLSMIFCISDIIKYF